MQRLLNLYRRTLTNYQSSLAYALLGIIGGVASGLIVISFEQAIALLANLWGVGVDGDDFESLPPLLVFALPVVGAFVLGLGFWALPKEQRETGIVHVISRMHYQYGVLPFSNALVQFVGGAFALATGQSGGREGPGVHLGGAANSLLGQKLGLPNNSLRILIACGTAGGIAAAFNTPLAGVIFAMEVIIAEYSVAGFIPVMLAAVSASAISRTLAGGAAVFSVPAVDLNSLWEIPYIVVLGICCGIAVACFIQLSKLAAKLSHWPVLLRFSLAGLITGSLGLLAAEILGIGYDTINLVLHGEIAVMALLTIAACKLLATSFSCGVGMPIGLIGPNLLIGACLGGCWGFVGQLFYPEIASDSTLYVVIGMAAAMGAVLNAPLAAILAVIELTQTVSTVMPALLAIVAATLTNTGVFRQKSAHQTVLRQLQRLVPDDPLTQLLHSTDVTSRMEISVVKLACHLDAKSADPIIKAAPAWCIVQRESESLFLVQGKDLAVWLAENIPEDDSLLDLTGTTIRRWTIADVPVQATLRQALDTMRSKTVEAVCVYGRNNSGNKTLQGIVTRESIEKFTLARL